MFQQKKIKQPGPTNGFGVGGQAKKKPIEVPNIEEAVENIDDALQETEEKKPEDQNSGRCGCWG